MQRNFAAHGIDAVEVGVALSALTFILVSRATPPTPDENLRIFFDAPGSPEGCATGTTEEDPVSTTTTFDIFTDEAVETGGACRDRT